MESTEIVWKMDFDTAILQIVFLKVVNPCRDAFMGLFDRMRESFIVSAASDAATAFSAFIFFPFGCLAASLAVELCSCHCLAFG
jgi:hypothetical protein